MTPCGAQGVPQLLQGLGVVRILWFPRGKATHCYQKTGLHQEAEPEAQPVSSFQKATGPGHQGHEVPELGWPRMRMGSSGAGG